jgi:hypothetical protein
MLEMLSPASQFSSAGHALKERHCACVRACARARASGMRNGEFSCADATLELMMMMKSEEEV